MTVAIAKRRIEGTASLSEHARLTLKFVRTGPEWLDWAIQNRRASYRFEDEQGLLVGIQEGLHAAALVLLPALGLLIGPQVLMGLPLDEVRLLSRAEKPGADSDTIELAQAALHKHGFATQSGLKAGTDLLKQLGVRQQPLFQAMSIGDLLELRELAAQGHYAQPPVPGLAEDAAKAALQIARTPAEFADYYRAYIDLAAALGISGKARARRDAAWGEALDALHPLLFNAIDCPRVEGPAQPWDVAAAIDEWLMMGRRLGFARLSLAVQQVIANASYKGQDGEAAEEVVALYLASIQSLLMNTELGDGRLAQDGTTRTFQIASAGQQATIVLASSGSITLSAFRSIPGGAEPSPPTPKNRGHHGKG